MAQLKKYNFKKDVNPVFECIKAQAALAGLTDYLDPFALGKFGYGVNTSGSRYVNIVRSRHIVEGRDALVRSAAILAGLTKASYLNQFIGKPTWTDDTNGVAQDQVLKLVHLPEKNIWYQELERACQPLVQEELDIFASHNDGRAFMYPVGFPAQPHFVDLDYFVSFPAGKTWQVVSFVPILISNTGQTVTNVFNLSIQSQPQYSNRKLFDRPPDFKVKATLLNDTTAGAQTGNLITCFGTISARDTSTGQVYTDIVLESPCQFSIIGVVGELIAVVTGGVLLDNNLRQGNVSILGQPVPYVLGRYVGFIDEDGMETPQQISIQLNVRFYNTTLGSTFRIKTVKITRNVSGTNINAASFPRNSGEQLRKTYAEATLQYGGSGNAVALGDTYGNFRNFEEGVFTETSRVQIFPGFFNITGTYTMYTFASMGQAGGGTTALTVRTQAETKSPNRPNYSAASPASYSTTLDSTQYLESIGGPVFDGGNVPRGLIVKPNEPQGIGVTYEARHGGEEVYKNNFDIANPKANASVQNPDPTASNLTGAYQASPLWENRLSTIFTIDIDYETVSVVPNNRPRFTTTATLTHAFVNPAYVPISNRNYYRLPFYNKRPLGLDGSSEHRPNVLSLYPGKYKVRLIGGPFNVLDNKHSSTSDLGALRTGIGRWTGQISVRDLDSANPQVQTYMGTDLFFENEKSAIIASTKETPKTNRITLTLAMPYTFQALITPPAFNSGIDSISPNTGPLAGGTGLTFIGKFVSAGNIIDSILIDGINVINVVRTGFSTATGILPPGNSFGRKNVTMTTTNSLGLKETITYYNIFQYVNPADPVPSAPYVDTLSLFSNCRVSTAPVINGKFLNTIAEVKVGGVPVNFTLNAALTQITIISMPVPVLNGYCTIQVTMYDDWTFIVFSGGAEKLTAGGNYRAVPYRNIEFQISDKYPLYMGGEDSLVIGDTAIEIMRVDAPNTRIRALPNTGYVTDVYVSNAIVEHFVFTGPNDISQVVDDRTSTRGKHKARNIFFDESNITPSRTMEDTPRRDLPSQDLSRTLSPPVSTPSRTLDPDPTPSRTLPVQPPPVVVVAPPVVFTPPPPVTIPPDPEVEEISTLIPTVTTPPEVSQTFVRITVKIVNNYDIPLIIKELHFSKANAPLTLDTWQMPYGWESESLGNTTDGFSRLRPQAIDFSTASYVNMIRYGHPSLCIQGRDSTTLSFVFKDQIIGPFACRAILYSSLASTDEIITGTSVLAEDQFIARANQPTLDTSTIKYSPTRLRNLFYGNSVLRPRITNLYSHAVHKSNTANVITESFTNSTASIITLNTTEATEVTVIKRDRFGTLTGLSKPQDYVFRDNLGAGGKDQIGLSISRNNSDTILVSYELLSKPGSTADFIHWDLMATYCTTFNQKLCVTKNGSNYKSVTTPLGFPPAGAAYTVIKNVTNINFNPNDFFTDSFSVGQWQRIRISATGSFLTLFARKGVTPSPANQPTVFDYIDDSRDGSPQLLINTNEAADWFIVIKSNNAFVPNSTYKVEVTALDTSTVTNRLLCSESDDVSITRYPRGTFKTIRRQIYDFIGDQDEYVSFKSGDSYIPMYSNPMPLPAADLFMLGQTVELFNPNTGELGVVKRSTGITYESAIWEKDYANTEYIPITDGSGTILNNKRYKVNGYGLERILSHEGQATETADLPIIMPYYLRRGTTTSTLFRAESIGYRKPDGTLYRTVGFTGQTSKTGIHPSCVKLVSLDTSPHPPSNQQNLLAGFTPNPDAFSPGIAIGPGAITSAVGNAVIPTTFDIYQDESFNNVGVKLDMIHCKSNAKVAQFYCKPFIYLNRYIKNHGTSNIPILDGFDLAIGQSDNTILDQLVRVYYYVDFKPAANSGFAILRSSGPPASAGLVFRNTLSGGLSLPHDDPFLASPGSVSVDISSSFLSLNTLAYPGVPFDWGPFLTSSIFFSITDTAGNRIFDPAGKKFPRITLDINLPMTSLALP